MNKSPVRAEIMVWLLVAFILSLTAVSLASVSIYFQLRQPKVVTVDLLTLATDARHKFNNGARMARFGQELQRELKRLAKEDHLIILSTRAVAAGAPEITAQIHRKLLP